MSLLESINLEGWEKPAEKQFKRMFVNQAGKAKDRIFDEISEEVCDSNDNIHLANRYFHNKKSLLKDKLGDIVSYLNHE